MDLTSGHPEEGCDGGTGDLRGELVDSARELDTCSVDIVSDARAVDRSAIGTTAMTCSRGSDRRRTPGQKSLPAVCDRGVLRRYSSRLPNRKKRKQRAMTNDSNASRFENSDTDAPTNDSEGTVKPGGLGEDNTIPANPDGVAAGLSDSPSHFNPEEDEAANGEN